MKLGLVRKVASVLAFSSLIFFGAMCGAVAHADTTPPPENQVATFHAGRVRTARIAPVIPSHVQLCTVAKNGAMTCSSPVALQGKADPVTK